MIQPLAELYGGCRYGGAKGLVMWYQVGGFLAERSFLACYGLAAGAMGEYVIKYQFRSNRTQRYIRLHMSLSAFRFGMSLNDVLAHG
jgi:hypothetical protein